MAFAGNPPLQALWRICSNFLPLSAYNFIAAFCNCPLIGYIIPLSVKKSNIWHSASFFLFTTNIDFAYCVLTCSFYISNGIIPSLRHIQFDMIKRCCTFLCSAAIIYWFYLYCRRSNQTGLPFVFTWNIYTTQDHPRRCGENEKSVFSQSRKRGSPPQVRGKL